MRAAQMFDCKNVVSATSDRNPATTTIRRRKDKIPNDKMNLCACVCHSQASKWWKRILFDGKRRERMRELAIIKCIQMALNSGQEIETSATVGLIYQWCLSVFIPRMSESYYAPHSMVKMAEDDEETLMFEPQTSTQYARAMWPMLGYQCPKQIPRSIEW